MLKRLERGWKRVVLGGAAALLPDPARRGPPDWEARPHRVLYLRYDRIGDMIMATGLIRVIATSYPTIELDVLASPANAAVLDGNPYPRRVLRFDRHRAGGLPSLLRELRAGRYDAVIDGMVLTPSVTMMLLMLASRAPYRIGIGGRSNDFIYTLPVAPAPQGAHAVDLAARTTIPFGIDPAHADFRTELFLSHTELARAEATWGSRARLRLLVNISAFNADRRWPADRYVTVLRRLRALAADARLLVTSAPDERELAASIAAAGGADVAHCGLRDVMALVAASHGVFTPDTSIAHVAAATNTPVAVLLRANFDIHAPYRARDVRVESAGPTLQDLPAERALAALPALLTLAKARWLA